MKEILILIIIIFIILILYLIFNNNESLSNDIPIPFVPNKELKFIHITKTGGSSIEDCAFRNKIYYGKYDKEYNMNHINIGNKTQIGYVSQWHILFPLNSIEYKQKYDWFMIVRNPYTRIISEINYLFIFNPAVSENIINHLDNINNMIQYYIVNRSQIGDHFTEQYLYLDPDPNIKIHVLKFENMKEDFDSLMKLYNIDIVLDVHKNKSKNLIKMEHLYKNTIELINSVYSKDFELFNYNKITYESMSRDSLE